MPQSSDVLYVARYKWPSRVSAFAYGLLVGVLRPSVREMWQESGAVLAGAVVVAYVVVVGGVLRHFLGRRLNAREVRELKPDNARAVGRGMKQVEEYRQELQHCFGGIWKE